MIIPLTAVLLLSQNWRYAVAFGSISRSSRRDPTVAGVARSRACRGLAGAFSTLSDPAREIGNAGVRVGNSDHRIASYILGSFYTFHLDGWGAIAQNR